jgi:pSer/pThr/pTyr-binding forkhead associated (FHA) protein
MNHFYIVRYPDSPVAVPEKGKVTIGRADNNTIVHTEPRVSRLHAQIEWRESLRRFVLLDLGSSNGTYLNNVKLTSLEETALKDGDKIRIASSVLTIRFVKNVSVLKNEFMELRQRVHSQVTEIVSLDEIKNISFGSGKGAPAIAGDLGHLCPIELFQLLESSRKTGRLKIDTLRGEGSFQIKNGKILTAQFSNLCAEQAVYETLRYSSGTFEFQPLSEILENPQITIPTTALLMEGCRLLDESKGHL